MVFFQHQVDMQDQDVAAVAVFFALFLTYVIALTRIRAEAGLPWSVGPVPYVHGTMVNIAGTHGFAWAVPQ